MKKYDVLCVHNSLEDYFYFYITVSAENEDEAYAIATKRLAREYYEHVLYVEN